MGCGRKDNISKKLSNKIGINAIDKYDNEFIIQIVATNVKGKIYNNF